MKLFCGCGWKKSTAPIASAALKSGRNFGASQFSPFTIVNGENWDAPKFLPLFKAAEAMGAVLFFHPQPQNNFMLDRTTRYGLNNSLGVIVEDAIALAMLIYGGVLDDDAQ